METGPSRGRGCEDGERERWRGGQGAGARQDIAGVHAPVCLAGMGQVEEKVKMREKGTEVHRHMSVRGRKRCEFTPAASYFSGKPGARACRVISDGGESGRTLS